jgi:hypothetical protein
MRFATAFSHWNGQPLWQERKLEDWLIACVDSRETIIAPKSGPAIRAHVERQLVSAGWALDVKIEPSFQLTVTGRLQDLAFQIQTGNASRAAYDLLKLQYLFSANEIAGAALVLPMGSASTIIGQNIASYERVTNELSLFKDTIRVPIMVIGFE